MTSFYTRLLFAALLIGSPLCAYAVAETATVPAEAKTEIPDDWEEQIDEQTEKLPEEIREQMREKLKEAVRRRLAEEGEADDSASDTEVDDSGEEKSKEDDDKAKQEKKEAPAKDPLSEESKKLKAEIDLFSTQFKHQIALYEKQIETQRLQNEKSKIDQKLEADRVAQQMTTMQRERDRLKLELDLAKSEAALKAAEHAARLAEAKAAKDALESRMSVEDAKEKLDDRILGEEDYPDEPFKDGVLRISLRRIELNGPIYQGAADYVCQRLDFFNNQSEKPIFLVIDNCPGGSAIEGMQIVQAIKESKAPVHVVVKRFAASMAAIITTLADHSYCYPDAIVLHHQASTIMYGNGRDLKDQMRQLREISERLIGPVAAKQGLTEEEFVDLMYKNRVSGDWELFGQQAVDQKWVDHIAHTIREEGVRKRPKGARKPPSILSILGEKTDETASGYLERYEVSLPEQVDEKGRRYVKLPRLSPVDAWMLYNPDEYYRSGKSDQVRLRDLRPHALSLTRRIEIGVLAHLPLDLLTLLLVIEHYLAVAEMAALDAALRLVEELFNAFDGSGRTLAAILELFRSLGAEAEQQDLVVQGKKLPEATGVALAAAAADQLAVYPFRFVQLAADDM